MVALLHSCTLVGIDAEIVDVECEMTRGLPGYSVVGLAATSVKEGAVRIRSALKAVGHDLPLRRVVVNLAPADLRKPGSALDLPIAAGVVLCENDYDRAPMNDLLVLGELGLDGSVRSVHGVLAAAILARQRGMRGVLVPECCSAEAAVVDGIEVYGIAHLRELFDTLTAKAPFRGPSAGKRRPTAPCTIDMSEVRGQPIARRVVEIGVAGGHNILLAGPPGTGKTMLARRIPTVLPALTQVEALETTKVYSALGLADGLFEERPFRAPHHTISAAALLGGGSPPRPGEISLAHNGVLFLDELPELARPAIEGLREPLEERSVTISRISGSITLPASFLLVAASNPCPCGWLWSGVRECTCSKSALERYRHRMSGPLLDRIDLHCFVKPVALAELRSSEPGECSAAIRERVAAARERQVHRLRRWNVRCNAEMPNAVLRATCRLDDACEDLLEDLVSGRRAFTARSINRLIRVARTIADLLDQDQIDAVCLSEAAHYRHCDPTEDLVPTLEAVA